MKKIGFIDYRLDEWHANNYPAWIRQANEALGTDYCVAYGWAEEAEPEGLLSTAAWCAKFGAQPCDTLEEAAEAADAHIAETDGDCTIQLFGRVSGRRYEPCSDFVTA